MVADSQTKFRNTENEAHPSQPPAHRVVVPTTQRIASSASSKQSSIQHIASLGHPPPPRAPSTTSSTLHCLEHPLPPPPPSAYRAVRSTSTAHASSRAQCIHAYASARLHRTSKGLHACMRPCPYIGTEPPELQSSILILPRRNVCSAPPALHTAIPLRHYASSTPPEPKSSIHPRLHAYSSPPEGLEAQNSKRLCFDTPITRVPEVQSSIHPCLYPPHRHTYTASCRARYLHYIKRYTYIEPPDLRNSIRPNVYTCRAE